MAVPPPHSAHVDSEVIDKTRQRGRARPRPSFDDAALPRRAVVRTIGGASTMLTDKRARRAQMRAVRDAFVMETPPEITAPVEFTEHLRPGLVVATYAPLGSEADPASLVVKAVQHGCSLALPHVVDRATPLRFLRWDGIAPLVAGPFGLWVPRADWPAVAPDVILTPLLAFDSALNRLGQGAGHYDRAFAQYPRAWRVGVAWSVQWVEALVPDTWDVPLHNLVTEQEWLTR